MRTVVDLTGIQFGKLKVISAHSKTRNGHIRWLCKCACGKESAVLGTHLKQGNTSSCGCSRVKRGKDHPQFTGHEDISGSYWSGIKRCMKPAPSRREIEFNITIEYAWDLFVSQNKRCALSDVSLYFPAANSGKGTASLDRIDSSKGYIEGNVQWVHKDVNLMKNALDQKYFTDLCAKIAVKSKEEVKC